MTKEYMETNGVGIIQPDNRRASIDPRKISALAVIGDTVKDKTGKRAGKIENIVFDLTTSTVSYIVLSVGGFAGIGDKLFALPLTALAFDPADRSFIVDEEVKVLKKKKGFNQHNWPDKPSWPP